MSKIGFTVSILKKEGRPSFESSLFVRIYLYGYLNGIRSSRKLAKECVRNIEMRWLLYGMTPNYHSISDFRKDNPVALKKLFKLFKDRLFCIFYGLIVSPNKPFYFQRKS